MDANELALVQGMEHTRATLRDWNREPWKVLRGWLGASLLIAFGLLFAVWVVAESVTTDITRLRVPGVTADPELGDVAFLFGRNLLVLALHSMACVAGFMAGSSLPVIAEQKTGINRWVHEKAGPLAIGFVAIATLFSLTTQAYALGDAASTIAWQFGLSPAELLACLSLHAIPELTALFLPLAAWMIASRKDRWNELLAATFVTTALALPVVLAAAFVEVYLTPELLVRVIGS
jgi:hypothetical protein